MCGALCEFTLAVLGSIDRVNAGISGGEMTSICDSNGICNNVAGQKELRGQA